MSQCHIGADHKEKYAVILTELILNCALLRLPLWYLVTNCSLYIKQMTLIQLSCWNLNKILKLLLSYIILARKEKHVNNTNKIRAECKCICNWIWQPLIQFRLYTHKCLAWIRHNLRWFIFSFSGILTLIVWTMDFLFVSKLNGADLASCIWW